MILLGDNTQLLPTIPDNWCHTFLTDIPYGEVNRKSQGLRQFDKGNCDSAPVDLEFVAEQAVRVTRGTIFVWCGWEQVTPLIQLFRQKYKLTTRPGRWIKTNPSPVNGQHFYLSAEESCVIAKKPGAPFFGHCIPAFWRGPSRRVLWKVEDGKKIYFPTPKPVWLLKQQIADTTPPGEMVLDPWMGSGSTLVAAKEIGRECLGMDDQIECVTLAKARYDAARRNT